jgi:hypothetical protein
VIPRAAWGPKEYAAATGRDVETAEVLKARVGSGVLSMKDARAMMIRQDFNPDLVGKEPK